MSGFGNLLPLIPEAEQSSPFTPRRTKNSDEKAIAQEVAWGALPPHITVNPTEKL